MIAQCDGCRKWHLPSIDWLPRNLSFIVLFDLWPEGQTTALKKIAGHRANQNRKSRSVVFCCHHRHVTVEWTRESRWRGRVTDCNKTRVNGRSVGSESVPLLICVTSYHRDRPDIHSTSSVSNKTCLFINTTWYSYSAFSQHWDQSF